MYDSSKTVTRCAIGLREEFKVEVCLHQGSPQPIFVCSVTAKLTDDVH